MGKRRQLVDLPLELFPHILHFITKTEHLLATCLVNKSFYAFSVVELYKNVYVYGWHKNTKEKVLEISYTGPSASIVN